MIHFRFHVVSIIAVFLALAIGTVMGSAFVGKAVIDRLESRINDVSTRADEARAENESLRDQIGDLDRYVEQSAQFAVDRTLVDTRLNVVAERGVDGATIDAQVDLLRQAGGTVPGVVWLEAAWALETSEQASALRAATGLTNRSRPALRSAAAALLGGRLAAPAPIPGDDVLAKLSAAKFVTLAGVLGTPTPSAGDFTGDVAGDAARVLAIGRPESDVPVEVIPSLAAGLVDASARVAVGQVFVESEEATERLAWIDAIANNDSLRNVISTIDDLDRVEGRVAATLALAELGGGSVGNYGLDRDRAVPERLPTVPIAR